MLPAAADVVEKGAMMRFKPWALLDDLSEGPARRLVVCVDDEPEILRALARMVRQEPYEFRTTTDPEEALDWVRSGEVDVLISDYRMPTMSGTTLLQLVKAYSPQTARMMLTGYPGEMMVTASGGAGLMDLVGKPWNDESLRIKIRSLMGPDAGPTP
jgi:DNA-binding NtrC family response regulator